MGRNGKDNNYWKAIKIQSIADEYLICLKQRNLGTCRIRLNENNASTGHIVSIMDAKKFIKRVEDVFNELDHVQQMIINNEFFYKLERMWWVNAYPHSTYYRIRTDAFAAFVSLWDKNKGEE